MVSILMIKWWRIYLQHSIKKHDEIFFNYRFDVYLDFFKEKHWFVNFATFLLRKIFLKNIKKGPLHRISYFDLDYEVIKIFDSYKIKTNQLINKSIKMLRFQIRSTAKRLTVLFTLILMQYIVKFLFCVNYTESGVLAIEVIWKLLIYSNISCK